MKWRVFVAFLMTKGFVMRAARRGSVRTNSLILLVLAVLAVVGGVVLVVLRNDADDQGDPGNPPPTAAEAVLDPLEAVRLKNTGIARLENGNQSDLEISDQAFAKLQELMPEAILPARNRVITCVLAVNPEGPDPLRSAAEREQWSARAAASLEVLLQREGDSAVVHILSGRLAMHQADEQRAVLEFQKATQLAPDDPGGWAALHNVGRDSQDEDVRQIAADALKHAYELRPDNLYLLLGYMAQQARAKDPEIVATLAQAKDVLEPYAASVKQLANVDLMELIEGAERAAEARKADPDTVNPAVDRGWTNVGFIGNVMRPEIAVHRDRRRVLRHELEYVISDFPPEFYETHSLPGRELPTAIPVKFVAADQPLQLPAVDDARDAHVCDFDQDGRLDVVVVRPGKVEVYGRGEDADHAWQIRAAYETSANMSHVLVIDIDRDVDESPEKRVAADEGGGDAPPTATDPPVGGNADGTTPPAKKCVDADLDLIVYGEDGILVLKNLRDPQDGSRSLVPVPQDEALQALKGVLQVAPFDLDADGDLDLIVSTTSGLSLWANRDNFTFADVSSRSLFPASESRFTRMIPIDWNRNVDMDVVLGGPQSESAGFLENLSHGRSRWTPFSTDLADMGAVNDLDVLDVDANASWDLVAATSAGLRVLMTEDRGSGIQRLLKDSVVDEFVADGVMSFDFDNDGYLDVLAWNSDEIILCRVKPDGTLTRVADVLPAGLENVSDCQAAEVDADGDLDLLVRSQDGLKWYLNEGGNENGWVDLLVRADPQKEPQKRSERVNIHGIGSLLELKAGTLYQPRVVTGQSTHFGLGKLADVETIRVLWTNGIPANVVDPKPGETVCEQQDLKGSCPYIYTWNGEEFVFFTDALWAAPIGLQFAEGVLAPAREWEYLLLPGELLAQVDGEYRLQFTEELWEAAYFDQVELLAVDHPAEIEVYSNEKVGPAEIAEFKIHTVRQRQLPVAARDQRGWDVLETVSRRDEVYTKGFDVKHKQGLTEEHFLELDLGDLTSGKLAAGDTGAGESAEGDTKQPRTIKLFLTGWVFPSDTSINIGLSQNPDLDSPRPPALWVPDANGDWQEVMPYMGFPGGKTKTICVDLTGMFPSDDYRVRIVTTMEFYWDEAFFTVDEEPGEHRVTSLELLSADLHTRGFSARIPHPQFGPVRYDYNEVTTYAHWPTMAGYFTRFGDVTPLLLSTDDEQVVMGAGDEMTLKFAVGKTKLPAGWKRDFVLHNVGWDKDADLNTVYGQTVEPLPFAGQQGYPDITGDQYPDTPRHREYLRKYQTRTQKRATFWNEIRDYRRPTAVKP